MASIKMIPEEEATGKVKEIYEEIKYSVNKVNVEIDKVGHLHKDV